MQKRWQKAHFTGFRNRYCSEKLEFPGVLAHFLHFVFFDQWLIWAYFPISKLESMAYNLLMQGQDIALLLQLAIQDDPRLPSKSLAENLAISPSEVSKALRRCVDAGLLYIANGEKRINRPALMEFLAHGLRYVYPPQRGSMVRGVPTAVAAEPLKSHFLQDGEPPTVWPYAEGKVRGLSLAPLYKGAPKAALLNAKLYAVLALCDAIRSGRTRERNLAVELLGKEIHV
jgi:DNA-binding MarR family transcriptional regulator